MKKVDGFTYQTRAHERPEKIMGINRDAMAALRKKLKSVQAKLKGEGMLKYILNQKFHGIPMSIEDVSIRDAILPGNIRDYLGYGGIETVRDLKKKTESELLVILKSEGGERSVKRVKEFMASAGLKLKKESK